MDAGRGDGRARAAAAVRAVRDRARAGRLRRSGAGSAASAPRSRWRRSSRCTRCSSTTRRRRAATRRSRSRARSASCTSSTPSRGGAGRSGGRWRRRSRSAATTSRSSRSPIEAAILLARRGRAALPALAGVGVAGAALLPLVLEQLDGEHGENVTAGASLAGRAKGVADELARGRARRGDRRSSSGWRARCCWPARRCCSSAARARAALLPAAVGGGGAALMLLAALAGADYLNNRNTLPVLVIAARDPGARVRRGPRRRRARRRRRAPCWLAATIGALIDPAHAREDWRGDSARTPRQRGASWSPRATRSRCSWYAPGLRAAPAASVRELAVVDHRPEARPAAAGRARRPARPRLHPRRDADARPPPDRPLPRRRAPAGHAARRSTRGSRTRLDPIRGAGGAMLLAR